MGDPGNKKELKPRIDRIHDQEWEKGEMEIIDDIRTIRQKDRLTRIIQKGPT